jgi:hypothetical protein
MNLISEGNMDFSVKNANYERVTAVMNRFLKEGHSNVCSCPRCINDITAIALNYLPPHYYVDKEAMLEAGSPWLMVETAVLEAIGRVAEHPNHPPHLKSTRLHDSPGLAS